MSDTITTSQPTTSQPEKLNLGQRVKNQLNSMNFSKMAAYSAFFGIGLGATYVSLVSSWFIAAHVFSMGGIVALLLATYLIIQIASYTLGAGASGLMVNMT